MEQTAAPEPCCQCGKEAPSRNRPVCVTCGEGGRRAVFCGYGSDCLNVHGPAAHRGRKRWRVATEHIFVPGSRTGHDVLGGFVPVDEEETAATAGAPSPPASGPPLTAEERFVTLALGLADEINGVTALVNAGTLTFDAAIAALEEVFVKFPPALHRLATAVNAGTVRVDDTE